MTHPKILEFREKILNKIFPGGIDISLTDKDSRGMRQRAEDFVLAALQEERQKGRDEETNRIWNEIFSITPADGRVEINDILDVIKARHISDEVTEEDLSASLKQAELSA